MPYRPVSIRNVIAKAGWLMANEYVQDAEGDTRRCWSQRYKDTQIYNVTVNTCTCWMGENRSNVICKHRWAAFGGIIVVLVHEILNSKNLEDLQRMAVDYKDDARDAPRVFVQAAREQYKIREQELRETEELCQ